ncbi:MAG TPA: ABC transporter permease [Candidatus Hydrogenedentes bacterium]|jgi:inositol transport system permease protein|nr:ABC transporter permease [Candidatus Hydrogenedentota bacterium]
MSLDDSKTQDELLRQRPGQGAWRRFGLVLALVAVCVVLAAARPRAMSIDYVLTLLRQVAINGILAVGVTHVLLTGGVDLSLGSVVALAGVVAATFAHPDQYPLALPLLLGLCTGAVCGVVNGLVVTWGRVAPFIATLGMMTAARGLAYIFSGGRPVSRLRPEFNAIGSGSLLGIPIPVVLLAVVALLSMVFLRYTRAGRHLYATGGNEVAAYASGINTRRVKVLAYILCGTLAGLAGIVQAARSTTGQPNAGMMYELDAIASVVIGGTSLAGGVGGVGGTLLGALLMGVISSGLDMLNVPSYYQQVAKGLIIIGAVMLDRRGSK